MDRYMQWDVDEVVYLDIGNPHKHHRTLLSQLPDISRDCFAPLATGGSIHSLNDIEKHLEAGSDRIVLGTAAIRNSQLVDEAAKRFGAQAIVVSVDYRQPVKGQYIVCHGNGLTTTDKQIVEWISELHQRGAGEILLHSMDRDGTASGYDLDLISTLSQRVAAPIVACGGAGDFRHFAEAISHGASAAAAANIFCFKELAYDRAKTAMVSADLPVRYA